MECQQQRILRHLHARTCTKMLNSRFFYLYELRISWFVFIFYKIPWFPQETINFSLFCFWCKASFPFGKVNISFWSDRCWTLLLFWLNSWLRSRTIVDVHLCWYPSSYRGHIRYLLPYYKDFCTWKTKFKFAL